MAWLSDSEKILKRCLFILTECTNVTDGQTTPRNGIGHACIASRDRNCILLLLDGITYQL